MSSAVSTSSGQRKGKGIHVTREQKSILKDAFKFIPYPDHYPESLNKLSADTGLDQEAIKKWFRNRRKKVGTKMVDNDDQEEVIDMQTDEASKSTDENVDESNEEIVQHGALASNEAPIEVLEGENLQEFNNPNNPNENAPPENAPAENVDDSVVEEIVAPPVVEGKSSEVGDKSSEVELKPFEVEDKSSEAEEAVVEPSVTVKSSEMDPEVVVPSSSPPEVERDYSNVQKDLVNNVVMNDPAHDTEGDNKIDDAMEKVNTLESEVSTNSVNNEVNPNETIEIVDNEEEETKQVEDVTEDMSTEEKAVQYDVLKSEFSNLQNKFESLAKVLGSHGIDIGSESRVPPSTSNVPSAEGLQPTSPTYHHPEAPVQQQVQYPPEQSPHSAEAAQHKQEHPYGWSNPGEPFVPKQEPQTHGWNNQHFSNPQMYNHHQWMQYPQQYPPQQSYPNNYVAPYLPPNYNLPYPPADYSPPYVSQPPVTPAQTAPPVPLVSDQPSPQTYKTPKTSRSKAPKKRATPTTQPRVTPYPKEVLPVPNSQSEDGGVVPTQTFQGVIGAAKKSFQGPSKSKPKPKSAVPATQTLYPQSAMPDHPSPASEGLIRFSPGPSKPKSRPQPRVPEVQTLYPPSALPPQVMPAKIPRRKTLPAKPKLGAHPKPLPKTVPVQYEQSLQASNPFRQAKQKASTSGRQSLTGKADPQIQAARRKSHPQIPTGRKALPGKAPPQIQTLYPPIQDSQPPKQQRPEVEVLRRVNKKTIQKPAEAPSRTIPGMSGVSVRKVPGPSFPMMSSSISIQKVYNPLSDPNKPQELKKVLSMTNLSVSLSRK